MALLMSDSEVLRIAKLAAEEVKKDREADGLGNGMRKAIDDTLRTVRKVSDDVQTLSDRVGRLELKDMEHEIQIKPLLTKEELAAKEEADKERERRGLVNGIMGTVAAAVILAALTYIWGTFNGPPPGGDW